MTTLTKDQAIENVYKSLENDNYEIDIHIDNLKAVLKSEGTNVFEAAPEKLPQNNRQGRKMMQSYFKKRGIIVNFKKDE
jgi:hypothetical protein